MKCIFEPRVVEFDRKRLGMETPHHPDVTEEIIELVGDSDRVARLLDRFLRHPPLI